MAEDFNLAEFVVPGSFIRVRAEGLIGVGGVSSGNIGIVGTAQPPLEQGENVADVLAALGTVSLGDYQTAVERFGRYDAVAAGQRNLTRALEVLFANGARTVFARGVPPGSGPAAFTAAFAEVVKDDVNVVVAPELSTADALGVLVPLVNAQETTGRDLIAVVGADTEPTVTNDGTTVGDVSVPADKRLVLAAPGIRAQQTLAAEGGATESEEVELPGRYTAAAVAGLISTLTPQSSPTNKTLPGVGRLARRFAYNEVRDLINGGVLVLEERRGVRVVRGVTAEHGANGPFSQITTRRIVDFAKAGIRQAADPFIGRLNNQRVRKALQGAIDGFLTSMVLDEALTAYTLEVTATRQDEIAGRAIVNALLQPTFSIDFIAVTLVLQ